MEQTISTDTDSKIAPALNTSAYLFRVFSCDQPVLEPARHDISGLSEIVISRGSRVSAVRENNRLVLSVPDGRISNPHASIRYNGQRWSIVDLQSRNGTSVNGASVESAVLEDGDWLECGRTFFRYRAALPAVDNETSDMPPIGPTNEVRTISPAFALDLERFAKVAASRVPLILTGNTGTGKEVFARAAHVLSARSGPFVAVNCAALPAALVESELFGYRRGAFSGATEDRPGLFRSAHGGTLLLDEIGDLSSSAQAALLRVLQERQVLPVGATRPIDVDFRLIVAGQQPLDNLVRAGRFRADLFARAAGFTLRLPPLCDRIEDLGLLISSILPRITSEYAKISFSRKAASALLNHNFPLNVRELERVLETALVLAKGNRIDSVLLSDRNPDDDTRLDASKAFRDIEVPSEVVDDEKRKQVVALLREHHGNISAIARATGKERVQIRRWLQRYGLDSEAFRKG